MKVGIIQFPGSNCERETRMAVQRAGMEPIEFLWNQDREKLRALDGYIIVGGFSYEDRSRAGIIAALDPVMLEIAAQSEQGKPVLGICNGAQILVETGLVPGLENNKVGMVLAENKRMAHGKILGTGFYNAWATMRVSDHYQRNAFTRHLTPKNILHVPVAHGEGRFVIPDVLLQEMQSQGLHVFQYCDEQGVIDEHFPVNPNGSIANIAAVSNKNGNVMAMMPHPERTTNGDPIFQSMRDYIISGRKEQGAPLHYYPRTTKTPNYQVPDSAHECVVELIITDNHAMTVQNTLRQMGIDVSVKRYTHWEIHGDSTSLQQAKESGVLFNERKEKMLLTEKRRDAKESMRLSSAPLPIEGRREPRMVRSASTGMYVPEIGNGALDKRIDSGVISEINPNITLLVRPHDDILGAQKLQTLHDHFNIKNINNIKHSVLWQFGSKNEENQDLLSRIMNTHIIANPCAHDCYHY